MALTDSSVHNLLTLDIFANHESFTLCPCKADVFKQNPFYLSMQNCCGSSGDTHKLLLNFYFMRYFLNAFDCSILNIYYKNNNQK